MILAFLVSTALAMDVQRISIGSTRITVEVARSSSEMEQGLMHRKSLDADAGMLFDPGKQMPMSYWMANCYIPLDIAFLSKDGTIINIEHMKVYPDPKHPPSPLPMWSSKGPARYALEVNSGFFARHGIKAGMKVKLPGAR